jgi:hypothetical protein
VTPDAVLIPLWTLCLVLCVRFARGESPWLLPAAAAAAGAACLAKLPGLLLLFAMGSALLVRRSLGRRLVLPAIAAAAALAAPLALLVVGELGGESGPAAFQLARLSSPSPSIVGPFAFLAATIGLAGILPAGGAVVLASRRVLGSGPAPLVLAWAFWPAMALFTLAAAAVHVEPNWGAVAFPSLFAGWALALDRLGRSGRIPAAAALALNLVIAALVHLHAAGLVAPSLVGRGPAARLHGWSETAAVIESTGVECVATDDYSLAAPLGYYGRGRLEVRMADPAEGAPPPSVLWSVEDGRLGLTRRIEGSGGGCVRIRRARQ